MSAEMEKHVHSMETVWTDISGYNTVGSRLDLVQPHDTQMPKIKKRKGTWDVFYKSAGNSPRRCVWIMLEDFHVTQNTHFGLWYESS